MMRGLARSLTDVALLLRLSLRVQLGRWSWLVPALAVLWPAYQAVALLAGWRHQPFEPDDVQNGFIGFPLVVLAIGLGVRIVATEIDQRTLEVAYTVPGGAWRVWIAKLGAASILLLASALLLALSAVFFVRYPLWSIYGAIQAAEFYLVLAAGLGALLRNEITAAFVASIVLALNGFLTGFGGAQTRWSPFFNPFAVTGSDEAEIFAWTLQNSIGFALLTVSLAVLTCARVERREKMLS